jgi:hypothetical protein
MSGISCIWCHAAPRRAHRLTCEAQSCRDAQDEHQRPAYDCREYARCDECGADAGAPCADEDDAWTRSPCRGRALTSVRVCRRRCRQSQSPPRPPGAPVGAQRGTARRAGGVCAGRVCGAGGAAASCRGGGGDHPSQPVPAAEITPASVRSGQITMRRKRADPASQSPEKKQHPHA